jgi:hypothetical protein
MALLYILVVVAVAALTYVPLFVGRRGRNLPNGNSNLDAWNNLGSITNCNEIGPPTLPLIGNLH